MCPALNGKVCTDEMGTPYGVLCDTHFIGIIITTSGKRKRNVQRNCQSMATIEGAFPAEGEVAAIRQ
jgi:hypothetical protein